jgi:hypothetical protein
MSQIRAVLLKSGCPCSLADVIGQLRPSSGGVAKRGDGTPAVEANAGASQSAEAPALPYAGSTTIVCHPGAVQRRHSERVYCNPGFFLRPGVLRGANRNFVLTRLP